MQKYMASLQDFFSKLFASSGNRKRHRNGILTNGQNCVENIETPKFQYTAGYIKKQLRIFTQLLDDDDMEDLMTRDICRKLTDKYLLAMVFVYFLRAELDSWDFTRENFFAALLLAVDMEEEDLTFREELLCWAMEDGKFTLSDLHARKDNLWHAMDFRAAVSMKTCHDVMSVLPTLSIWRRQRPLRHAGAVRKTNSSQSSFGTCFFHCSDCQNELDHNSMSFESSSSMSSYLPCDCGCCCSCSSSRGLSSQDSTAPEPPSKKAATQSDQQAESCRLCIEE